MSYHMVSRGVKGYHPNMERITYGDWLKAMRRSHGNMTQQELADQVGVHRSYIVKIETGKVKLPEEETRLKFHNVFATSDDDLRELGVIEELDLWGRPVLSDQSYIATRRGPGRVITAPASSPERDALIEAIIEELKLTEAPEHVLRGVMQILSGVAFSSSPEKP